MKKGCYPGIQIYDFNPPVLPAKLHTAPVRTHQLTGRRGKKRIKPCDSKFWSTFYSTDIDYLMREQILWNMVISGPLWIIHTAVLHRKGRHGWGWSLRKRKRDWESEVMEHVGLFWTRSLITSVYQDLVRSSLTWRCRLAHWVSFCLSWPAANLICLLTQISVELLQLIKTVGCEGK